MKRATKSAYAKMSKAQKVNVVAQEKAVEFLKNIYKGYDQDNAPLYGTSAEKLQDPAAREEIPVLSDISIWQLKELLVEFYNRNIKV